MRLDNLKGISSVSFSLVRVVETIVLHTQKGSPSRLFLKLLANGKRTSVKRPARALSMFDKYLGFARRQYHCLALLQSQIPELLSRHLGLNDRVN